jgi:hypothetical protein
MVVFGCGAAVKGLSAASRQDGMVFDPCRAAFNRGVDEDQGVLTQAVSAILRRAKIFRCVAAASAARRVVGASWLPALGSSLMRA